MRCSCNVNCFIFLFSLLLQEQRFSSQIHRQDATTCFPWWTRWWKKRRQHRWAWHLSHCVGFSATKMPVVCLGFLSPSQKYVCNTSRVDTLNLKLFVSKQWFNLLSSLGLKPVFLDNMRLLAVSILVCLLWLHLHQHYADFSVYLTSFVA